MKNSNATKKRHAETEPCLDDSIPHEGIVPPCPKIAPGKNHPTRSYLE